MIDFITASSYESCVSVTWRTLTGCCRPITYKIGQFRKYSENFPASIVADITIIFNGWGSFVIFRLVWASLMTPKRMSVATLRSCASSRMIQEYFDKLKYQKNIHIKEFLNFNFYLKLFVNELSTLDLAWLLVITFRQFGRWFLFLDQCYPQIEHDIQLDILTKKKNIG